jgi:hypothetical protein
MLDGEKVVNSDPFSSAGHESSVKTMPHKGHIVFIDGDVPRIPAAVGDSEIALLRR